MDIVPVISWKDAPASGFREGRKVIRVGTYKDRTIFQIVKTEETGLYHSELVHEDGGADGMVIDPVNGVAHKIIHTDIKVVELLSHLFAESACNRYERFSKTEQEYRRQVEQDVEREEIKGKIRLRFTIIWFVISIIAAFIGYLLG